MKNIMANFNESTDEIQASRRGPFHIFQVFHIFLVVLLIFFSNINILLVVRKTDSLGSSVTGLLMSVLSVIDLATGFCALPATVCVFTNKWIFGRLSCTVLGLGIDTTLPMTGFTLAILSIDRYIFIFHPLRYHAIFTKRRVLTLFAIGSTVWGITSGINHFIGSLENIDYIEESYVCFETFPPLSGGIRIISAICFYIWMFLCTSTISFCYHRIYRLAVKKQVGPNDVNKMDTSRKTIKTVVLITGAYLLAFILMTIYVAFLLLGYRRIPLLFYSVHYMALSNSFCNWPIYYFTHRDFREGQKRIMKELYANVHERVGLSSTDIG